MNAIYVHGLGSGAATNGLSTIAKILSQYKWHAVEEMRRPMHIVPSGRICVQRYSLLRPLDVP